MKRIVQIALILECICLAGCGEKNYKDGTYTAQSAEYHNDEEGDDSGNGYGVVTLTISGNHITECIFQTFELDGTLKDTDYGKENGEIANKDFYNKAQKAVGACSQYAARLVSAGDLDSVDAISGATVNYGEFKEAVELALKQAEQ